MIQLRYFKQYGTEASGSLIHPHMQSLGRELLIKIHSPQGSSRFEVHRIDVWMKATLTFRVFVWSILHLA